MSYYIFLIHTKDTLRLAHVDISTQTDKKEMMDTLCRYITWSYGEQSSVSHIGTLNKKEFTNVFGLLQSKDVFQKNFFSWYDENTCQVHVPSTMTEETYTAWIQEKLTLLKDVLDTSDLDVSVSEREWTSGSTVPEEFPKDLKDRKPPPFESVENMVGISTRSQYSCIPPYTREDDTPEPSFLDIDHNPNSELTSTFEENKPTMKRVEIVWDNIHRQAIMVEKEHIFMDANYPRYTFLQNGETYQVNNRKEYNLIMDTLQSMKCVVYSFDMNMSLRQNVMDTLDVEEFETIETCMDTLKKATNVITHTQLKEWIQQNYRISVDMNHRIQYTVLLDSITKNIMNVYSLPSDNELRPYLRKNLPYVFKDLGLHKKRYRDGIFWYGLELIDQERLDTIGELDTMDVSKRTRIEQSLEKTDVVHTYEELLRQRRTMCADYGCA